MIVFFILALIQNKQEINSGEFKSHSNADNKGAAISVQFFLDYYLFFK